MFEDHQLLYELKEIAKNHGIKQGKAVLAYELYMELCEVYKLWDVEHHFHEKLSTFYLTGKVNKDESAFVYIPLTTDETLSMEHIEVLQTTLSPINKSLILVFRDRDSSSTHYRITQGLQRPDSPSTAQRKKTEERKCAQYQKYLSKWRRKLYTKALEDERESSQNLTAFSSSSTDNSQIESTM